MECACLHTHCIPAASLLNLASTLVPLFDFNCQGAEIGELQITLLKLRKCTSILICTQYLPRTLYTIYSMNEQAQTTLEDSKNTFADLLPPHSNVCIYIHIKHFTAIFENHPLQYLCIQDCIGRMITAIATAKTELMNIDQDFSYILLSRQRPPYTTCPVLGQPLASEVLCPAY